MTACKYENNVDIGSYWTWVEREGPHGEFPNNEMYFLPILCQHCETPECISVCPTAASYKRKDGIVLVDKEKCIGCGLCLEACPYDVRVMNNEHGVAEKCTLCAHLIDQGEQPNCVKNCAGRCRIIGDFDDPTSEVSKMLKAAGVKNVHHLEDLGNKPVGRYILKKFRWRSG